MARFPAAAAPSREGEEEKSDDTTTGVSRKKPPGLKQTCTKNSPVSHTLKFSQLQMEATLPSFNVGTDPQETPGEFTGKYLPEQEEFSIPTQTFSPMRKIKRKVHIYKRKREKFESHVGCANQNVILDDSKLEELLQSSDGMDVEFQGFKDWKQGK